MVCDILDVSCQITTLLDGIWSIFGYVISVFVGLVEGIKYAILEIVGFIGDIINLGSALSGFVTNYFGAILPDAWTSLIILAVSTVILMRIYFYLKDVEILGFKI